MGLEPGYPTNCGDVAPVYSFRIDISREVVGEFLSDLCGISHEGLPGIEETLTQNDSSFSGTRQHFIGETNVAGGKTFEIQTKSLYVKSCANFTLNYYFGEVGRQSHLRSNTETAVEVSEHFFDRTAGVAAVDEYLGGGGRSAHHCDLPVDSVKNSGTGGKSDRSRGEERVAAGGGIEKVERTVAGHQHTQVRVYSHPGYARVEDGKSTTGGNGVDGVVGSESAAVVAGGQSGGSHVLAHEQTAESVHQFKRLISLIDSVEENGSSSRYLHEEAPEILVVDGPVASQQQTSAAGVVGGGVAVPDRSEIVGPVLVDLVYPLEVVSRAVGVGAAWLHKIDVERRGCLYRSVGGAEVAVLELDDLVGARGGTVVDLHHEALLSGSKIHESPDKLGQFLCRSQCSSPQQHDPPAHNLVGLLGGGVGLAARGVLRYVFDGHEGIADRELPGEVDSCGCFHGCREVVEGEVEQSALAIVDVPSFDHEYCLSLLVTDTDF